MEKTKFKKFVDRLSKFGSLSAISGILMNMPLNIYGGFKGYRQSGRQSIIPDSDWLSIFQKIAIGFLFLGIFLLILTGFLKIVLEIKKRLKKK